MSTITLVEGDIGTKIDVTITETDVDGNVSVMPLVGGDTITYVFEYADKTRLSVTGSIQDGPNGVCRYVTQAGDVKPGNTNLQVTANKPSAAWIGSTEIMLIPVARKL